MSKKKAIKIATASAIALTGAVAVAQPQADAATNSVDKAITKATTQVNKAFNLYYNTTKKSNKLPSGSAIRKEVKLAEQYYAAAQKEIAKNGGSKKASYTKKLEASKTSLNRAKNYVAAISVTLKASRTDLDKAIASGKQGTVASKHAALEKKIAEFEKAVAKVFGPDARRLLTKTYTTPAKAEAAAVATEVKVYAAYKEIESKKLITTDLEKAGKLIESVKADVEKLKAKNTTLAKNLVKAAEKNNKAYEAALPAVVTAVSATNASTLTLTGTSLNNLKVEDITVAGNTVKSVSAAADGKSATVTLENSLNVDVATKVTAKGKDFEVTYKVTATGVTLTDGATYDDDTAKQFIKVNVDGRALTASELITAGYDVKFEAFSNKAATTQDTTFFKGGLNTSSTGELSDAIAVPTEGKDIYVKVTVTKGAQVLTSPLVKVKVINKDLAANTISAATLYNTTNSVEQSSSTLKTGEKAKFSEIEVKSGSRVDYYNQDFVVKSSDESIVSVNKVTNEFEAQGPGTATLTVTFGGATYTKTITVKNEKREATSVKVSKTTVAAVKGGTVTAKVQLLDQYGDPMTFVGGTDLKAVSSNNTVATATVGNPSGAKLEAEIQISGVDTGSALFTFRDNANAKLGTTSLAATVTENGTLSQYTVAVDNDITSTDLTAINTAVGKTLVKEQISTDATIDIKDDSYVKLSLKGLNSAGQEIDAKPAASSYTVTTNVSAAGVLAATPTFSADGFIVVEAGTKAGTATITVTNKADGKVVKTFQVTVTDIGNNVTGATFKNITAPTYETTLNYEDFLSYTESSKDPIITGLTLSKSTTQPVRLALTTGAGDLYIDKDGDAVYDAGEIKVGSVAFGNAGTITNFTTNAVTGFKVTTADDGTVIFKVLNSEDEVVASKALTINF
ncbi:hypothetical protein [Peribacillus asahii]|uniref:hypothetical protein n=1 Tax=Peribacillus asahii TaxID=228899 RepID=UPI003825FEE2